MKVENVVAITQFFSELGWQHSIYFTISEREEKLQNVVKSN